MTKLNTIYDKLAEVLEEAIQHKIKRGASEKAAAEEVLGYVEGYTHDRRMQENVKIIHSDNRPTL